MKRILIPLLALLGVAAIVAGILAGTRFRPADHIVATPTAAPTAPLVVIDAGVAPLVDDDVDMTITGDGPITVVRATPDDIDAWVGELAVQHITGLANWQHLQISDVSGEGSGKNPASAEMFAEIRTAENKLTWQLSDSEHRWAFLLASNGTDAAPTVSLKWKNPHAHNYMAPLLIIGVVLLTLAILWWLTSRFGKRRAPDEDAEVIYVPALTPQEAEGLTRKQIRELEREREQAAYQEARRAGKRNVSILTSQTIPVIDAPLLEQHPERLIDSGMAGGAAVVPFAPDAGGKRLAAGEHERFAPLPADDARGEGQPVDEPSEDQDGQPVERMSIAGQHHTDTRPAGGEQIDTDKLWADTPELWADTPRDNDEVDN